MKRCERMEMKCIECGEKIAKDERAYLCENGKPHYVCGGCAALSPRYGEAICPHCHPDFMSC